MKKHFKKSLGDWIVTNGGGSVIAEKLSTEENPVTRQSLASKVKNGWIVEEMIINGQLELRMYNPKHFIKVG